MTSDPAPLLATLGHPQRLAVFRLLMRRYPDRLPAGEIAQVLGLRASTLSLYLSGLREAGLITQERRGTSLRYAAEVAAAGGLMRFLFADCCRNRPELCLPKLSCAAPVRKHRVLFVCSGNSTGSIMAEALLRDHASDRFDVVSAGTQPRPGCDGHALALLRARGHDVAHLRPKPVSEFLGAGATPMDFVLTVCDRAANAGGPVWSGRPVLSHWGPRDPGQAPATDTTRAKAVEQIYAEMQARIARFAALPFDRLDRQGLQARVDDIAHLKEEETT